MLFETRIGLKMKNKIRNLLNIAAAVFAAAAVICIAVTAVVLFRPLYYFDMEHLNIPENSGIPESVVRANYDTLIDYNLLGGPNELLFPDMSMSEQGRIHFEEVKDIFIAMQLISIAAVILLVIWLVMRKKGKNPPFQWMKLTGVVVAAITAVVACTVVIDWNLAFTAMHKMFFRNDYWIFNDVTDPVIKILPEEFFLHCGVMIIIISLFEIVMLQVIYRRLKNERNEF